MIAKDYKTCERVYNTLLRSAWNVNGEMISEEELFSFDELGELLSGLLGEMVVSDLRKAGIMAIVLTGSDTKTRKYSSI